MNQLESEEEGHGDGKREKVKQPKTCKCNILVNKLWRLFKFLMA